jgi:hypothetical protein
MKRHTDDGEIFEKKSQEIHKRFSKVYDNTLNM